MAIWIGFRRGTRNFRRTLSISFFIHSFFIHFNFIRESARNARRFFIGKESSANLSSKIESKGELNRANEHDGISSEIIDRRSILASSLMRLLIGGSRTTIESLAVSL